MGRSGPTLPLSSCCAERGSERLVCRPRACRLLRKPSQHILEQAPEEASQFSIIHQLHSCCLGGRGPGEASAKLLRNQEHSPDQPRESEPPTREGRAPDCLWLHLQPATGLGAPQGWSAICPDLCWPRGRWETGTQGESGSSGSGRLNSRASASSTGMIHGKLLHLSKPLFAYL